MKIVDYHELSDKSGLFVLWAKCFSWYCPPQVLARWTETDSRLKGTPVGYCMVVDGVPASFVGVMEIPTRNKHGEEEIIGGIWAVTTLPRFFRQGFAGALLERAEDYFRSRGLRFSMLMTSRTMIAYRGYRSFGYEEIPYVNDYSHYFKFPRRALPQKLFVPEIKSRTKRLDLQATLDLFQRYTENRCGFVFRQRESLLARQHMGFFEPGASAVTADGYLLGSQTLGTLVISEVVAFSAKRTRELIREALSTGCLAACARYVFDPQLARVLEQLGFRNDPGSYGVLMAKPLAGAMIDQVYDPTFTCSSVDFF